MTKEAANQNSYDPYLQSNFFMQNDDTFKIDFSEFFLIFWRRKYLVMLFALAGFLLSSLIVLTIPPKFTAKSILLIDSAQYQGMPAFLQALSRGKGDSSFILGEIEIIRSRLMGRLAVQNLDLINDSEFNPALGHTSNQETDNLETSVDIPSTQDIIREGFRSLSFEGTPYNAQVPQDQTLTETVVSQFLESLAVRSIPGSSAIQVEFSSKNPHKAAKITNAVVDLYIQQRLEDRFRAVQRVNDWLDQRLQQLKQDVTDAEDALQAYKIEHRILQGKRTFLSAEQLSDLTSRLINEKSKLAEAEARIRQVKAMDKKNPDLEAIPEVLESTIVQRLKTSISTLEADLSDLETRYGERHPRMIQKRSELDELRSSIADEMRVVIRGLENNQELAHERIRILEEELDIASDQSLEDNEVVIGLQALERQVAAARLIYDKFLNSQKQSGVEAEIQESEARVISYAVAPFKPKSPNKNLIIGLGTFLALNFGLFLALILEKLDQSFKTSSGVEDVTGMPCYALVPSGEADSLPDLGNFVVNNPSSLVAEAVRTLRMVINLRAREHNKKPKVIAVTSSFSGEGKSVLCSWLGRIAAKSGEKVVLVDCDLRRPSIHGTLGHANETSLVEYLTGNASLEDVIHKDPETGLHVIYGRSVPNSALDLVGSKHMRHLVEALREAYDLVLIDTPACLAVSDARVLSTLSDLTLYGIAWAETPHDAVLQGVRQFSDIRVRMASVLLNVDVKRQARYGYADAVYYYDADVNAKT